MNSLFVLFARATIHLAELPSTVLKDDCPSSPVPAGLHSYCSGCNQAWARLPLVHTSSLCSERYGYMTLLTFLWLNLCRFGHRHPLLFLDFLIMEGLGLHLPMLAVMHEQLYRAKAHLFQLCQINWSFGVKNTWYRLPSVSMHLICKVAK